MDRLTVHGPETLALDVGAVEHIAPNTVIHPPERPIFDQLIDWLDSRPEAAPVAPDSPAAGIATTLACVRWGTWLALLADPALPPWKPAKDGATSCITNSEMARLNIEASSALELWIDLLRGDSQRWSQLAGNAVAHLPWSGGRPTRTMSPLALLNQPALHDLVATQPKALLDAMRARVAGNPTRICANAIINCAWRNGPIEDVHAGRYQGAPLTHRRVLPAAEKGVLRHAAGELAIAIERLATTSGQNSADWADTVLPFSLPGPLWSAPMDWSTSERSRVVIIGADPR